LRLKRRDDTRRVEILAQHGNLPALGAQIKNLVPVVGASRVDHGRPRGELGEDCVFALQSINFRNFDLARCNLVLGRSANVSH
jgi:hypothetical protein